jgi:hypothetical protein
LAEKRMKRGCLIAVLMLVAAVGVLWLFDEAVFLGPARTAREAVLKADHRSLLEACRTMMSQMSTYTDESTVPRSRPDARSIVIKGNSSQFVSRVPSIIVALHPSGILLMTNEVRVILRGPPCRVSVRAFAPGAQESGWRKLRDGLWMD